VPKAVAQLVATTADVGIPSGAAAAAVILPLLGFAAYRTVTYGKLEYITAAMLTNHVPRGGNGAVVIQAGGGTRELYYYPKDTRQVTVVGVDINRSLLEQAGIQAQVPTKAYAQAPSDLGFAPPGSTDAVVSLGALGAMSERDALRFLDEAARVLRSGAKLVFVEKNSERALRLLRSSANSWDDVEYDMATEVGDQHVVGVATRATGMVSRAARRPDVEGMAAGMLAKREASKEAKAKVAQQRAEAKKDKGFS